MMDEMLPESWHEALGAALATEEARRLDGWLRAQEDSGTLIFPPRGNRLKAFAMTPLEEVKVVILGQDPYHGPGQAHGLSFSVPEGVKKPPSLSNICKELQADLGIPFPAHGNLEHWARQGVLLLNNALTVEAGLAGAHQGIGWEAITDAAVEAVAARAEPTVFILWGNHARKKASRLAALKGDHPHLVIESAHPSPLSAHAGFFGSRPFSRANTFLQSHGRGTIDWAT